MKRIILSLLITFALGNAYANNVITENIIPTEETEITNEITNENKNIIIDDQKEETTEETTTEN